MQEHPNPDLIPPELAEVEGVPTDDEIDAWLADASWSQTLAVNRAEAIGPDDDPLEDDDEIEPPWCINSDGEAEWALRKMGEYVDQVDELQDAARAWRERIDEWLASQITGPSLRARFFEAHLEDWVFRLRHTSSGKVKSRKYPSGEVASSGSTDPKVKIVNPERVAAWAGKNAPDAVRVTTEVLVTDLRKCVHAEVVPVEREVEIDGETVVEQTAEIRVVIIPEGATVDKKSGRVVNGDGEYVGIPVDDLTAAGISWEIPKVSYRAKLA